MMMHTHFLINLRILLWLLMQSCHAPFLSIKEQPYIVPSCSASWENACVSNHRTLPRGFVLMHRLPSSINHGTTTTLRALPHYLIREKSCVYFSVLRFAFSAGSDWRDVRHVFKGRLVALNVKDVYLVTKSKVVMFFDVAVV